MRSILITGCRTGLGFEFVKQFAQQATSPELIIATCKDISKAPELSDLAKKYKQIKLLELDVTEYESFNNFSSQVGELVKEKGLNVLLHNAGILTVKKQGTIEELTSQNLIEQFRTNTVGPIMLTKALLPQLRRASQCNSEKPMSKERAAIFAVSSFLGSHALNDRAGCWGYRESKSALNMALLSLKVELKEDVIGTMMMHPGWVKTNMGAEGAQVDVDHSVTGMITLINDFSEKTNGAFLKFDGSNIPW